jgi:AAA15 family ATPase/GTPase
MVGKCYILGKGSRNRREFISIKNFGPIKDITIDDVKPLTVLIGESGSGKSTLMKVLALFRYINKMQNIRSYLNRSNVKKSPFGFKMDDFIRYCGFKEFIKNKPEIIYTTSNDVATYTHEFSYKNGRLSVDGIIKPEYLEFLKIGFISEKRNVIPQWLDKAQSANLGFYFGETSGDFKLGADLLPEGELPIEFMNLKFKIEKTPVGIKYLIVSTGKDKYKIPYKDSSSGIQNVVPLLVIMDYFSKHFDFKQAFERSVLKYLYEGDRLTAFKAVKEFPELPKKIYLHIEEPELSLYPRTQCLLMDDVVNKCFNQPSNYAIELMMATHSPYVINHLNLLIQRYDRQSNKAKYKFDDLAVYYIEDGRLRNLKIKNERLIDTDDLSDPMDDIYDEYEELK